VSRNDLQKLDAVLRNVVQVTRADADTTPGRNPRITGRATSEQADGPAHGHLFEDFDHRGRVDAETAIRAARGEAATAEPVQRIRLAS
jgi:hypothetical protein